ncbi:hypothetical protein ACX0G7_24410 [Flavitalea antarctica]
MKQMSLFLIFLTLATQIQANTITAQVNGGTWAVSSSWSPARQPMNGDTIIIPAGLTLEVDGNENLADVVVIVRGTLSFTNGKLRLDALSKVIVDYGGTITGQGNNDQITIGGVFKFRGTDPPVLGYAVADSSTGNGFGSFGVLPFRFISFTAASTDIGIQLNWSYNFSPETRYFDIQRSVDGKNWETKMRITAEGQGETEVRKYNRIISDLAAGIVHYRIVQVDYNNSAIYSEVRTVAHKNNTGTGKPDNARPNVYVHGNIVLVDFPVKSEGKFMIRLLNTNGQVMMQRQYEGAQSQVSVNVMNKVDGVFVLQVIEANKKANSFRLMLTR